MQIRTATNSLGPAALGAIEAAQLMAAGSLTSTELTRSCLDRIYARDPQVRAWAYLDAAAALAQARQRDAERPRSKLHGIPIGIKDIIDTRQIRTSCGSPIYVDRIPDQDARCVAILRDCGAVILGKTKTTEFAYFRPTDTTNPHDGRHTPGGSSSGSAAAVADYQVPLALGTQTAGSIIRPASFNGVVGFKPSYGVLSMAGVQPLAPSLDTLGVFARRVRDAAVVCELLGRSTGDFSIDGPARPASVGLVRTSNWALAEPAVQAGIAHLISRLREHRVAVEEIDFDPRGRLAEVQQLLMAQEAAQTLGPIVDSHPDRVSKPLKTLIAEGRTVSSAALQAAQEAAAAGRVEIARVLERVDCLLTPSAPGEAPLGLSSTGDPVFNRVWTLLGLPCISLPLNLGSRGLPLGVQLVGRTGRDRVLLQQAVFVQELIGYPAATPM